MNVGDICVPKQYDDRLYFLVTEMHGSRFSATIFADERLNQRLDHYDNYFLTDSFCVIRRRRKPLVSK